jgi:hypothetical protein
MSTNYYRLKRPFSSARATVGGSHTTISLWVNHAKAGDIVLRNEEVPGVLLCLIRDSEAVRRVGIGGGKTELYYKDDDVEPQTCLISECGEITSVSDLTRAGAVDAP